MAVPFWLTLWLALWLARWLALWLPPLAIVATEGGKACRDNGCSRAWLWG